jgi:subtilisin family serine protease
MKIRESVLSLATLAGRTGRGVRIAVIDTGIHAAHPHVGGIAGGTAFTDDGTEHGDTLDRLGHGTAVAAAIREKAPDASLLAVKVFDRALRTTGTALAAAIRWAIAREVHVINLSLGTTNPDHAAPLAAVVTEAAAAGILIVAAAPQDGQPWLPGALPGVVGVEVDWTCPRDACRVAVQADGYVTLRASGFPRPIADLPPERNLKGQSFAVANAAGLLALVVEDSEIRSLDALAATLVAV